MWVVLVLGCASPEVADFLDARAAALCARHARCDTLTAAGYADEQECVTMAGRADAETTACPGFDADAASACLAAWEVGCDEVPDLSICDAVCD